MHTYNYRQESIWFQLFFLLFFSFYIPLFNKQTLKLICHKYRQSFTSSYFVLLTVFSPYFLCYSRQFYLRLKNATQDQEIGQVRAPQKLSFLNRENRPAFLIFFKIKGGRGDQCGRQTKHGNALSIFIQTEKVTLETVSIHSDEEPETTQENNINPIENTQKVENVITLLTQ